MDYGSAVAHRLAPKKQASRPTKSMHIEELHDGTCSLSDSYLAINPQLHSKPALALISRE
jgi:hypothetical protein